MAGYLSGMITAIGATSLAVGGWKDHVHIFFGMPVTSCISDFMSIVKASSSKWINEQRFIKGKFSGSRATALFLIPGAKEMVLLIILWVRRSITGSELSKKSI
jgi:hypothetical protein